jgi:hypothetical protein
MIVPLSQDGRDWVENKLDPVDVGTLHRVEGSIEAMAAVMRQVSKQECVKMSHGDIFRLTSDI